MKNIIFLLSLALVYFTSCKKAEELTQFEIDYTSTIIIPSSTTINLPFNIVSPDIESNSDTKFEVNNTRKDKIESINLRKLQLDLKTPSSSSFKFLKSIEIYLQADGLNDVKMAWKENISDSAGNTLLLDVTSQDIKSFILQKKFNIRVKTVTDEILTADHEIEINSTFFVDAKLLGSA